ncbi:hypothetical protein CANCADRAFT_78913 [Tortispora caseinolytica NRRL Y-17796]|uniref:G-patch domain-containing protein n=1 Tax=Tortispora caseinolytica NRRL Y-17796 TaxID=767744 RepID=A0A1E4TJF8_9ASCO|nr:hypothetical protein CANCADRAFT_78913 [Tortispora caseinolytica NRRL Y-17796]
MPKRHKQKKKIKYKGRPKTGKDASRDRNVRKLDGPRKKHATPQYREVQRSRMSKEVITSIDHRKEVMARVLRTSRIVFVRSEDIYDPSKIVHVPEEPSIDPEAAFIDINTQSAEDEQSAAPTSHNSDLSEEESVNREVETVNEDLADLEVVSESEESAPTYYEDVDGSDASEASETSEPEQLTTPSSSIFVENALQIGSTYILPAEGDYDDYYRSGYAESREESSDSSEDEGDTPFSSSFIKHATRSEDLDADLRELGFSLSDVEESVSQKLTLGEFIEFLHNIDHDIIDVAPYCQFIDLQPPLLSVKFKGSTDYAWVDMASLGPEFRQLDLNSLNEIDASQNSDYDYDEFEEEQLKFRRWKNNASSAEKKKLAQFEMFSDDDLSEQLSLQYYKDRKKKATKKKERERLRATGQLGKKAAKKAFNPTTTAEWPDSWLAFPTSMTAKNLASELALFLHDPNSRTFALPPTDIQGCNTLIKLGDLLHLDSEKLDFQGRKYVKYSKEQDSISDKRTATQLVQTFFRGKRSYFHCLFPSRSPEVPKATTRKFAYNYRHHDGAVVGAKAAQIGPDNLGHQLLEKLGWSRGSKLGTDGEKGLDIPLPATVKLTKAGIGRAQ